MFVPQPVSPPPLWPIYVKLPKNQGLNIMRIKENYIKEQYEYENYINYINYINWLSMNQPKGPLPSTPSVGVFSSGYWDDNGVWIDTENWID